MILVDQYATILTEYQSIYKLLEGNLAPSKMRKIDSQLHYMEEYAGRTPRAYEGEFISRKVIFAAAVLDSVFQHELQRSRVRLNWAQHLDRMRSIVGPWPPKTQRQYRGRKIGYR